MIHELTIGFLDSIAILQRVVVVTRPLDDASVDIVLAEFPGLHIERKEGYVIAPWHGKDDAKRGEAFAIRLRAETGCVVADRRNGKLVEFGQAVPERVAS